jgi:hypothetical protein
MTRKKFKSQEEWQDFLGKSQSITGMALQEMRKDCYSEIETKRGRPLIIYASNFFIPQIGIPIGIDLNDVEGFTDLVNATNQSDSVDVLIQSPGGLPDATERIVGILRRNFKEVHFLIPHSAYSAATMLALSGDTITLHPSATLGPIDPQFNGIPARSIRRGFENVKKKIAEEGPESLPAYIPLIEKYSIELLEQCEDAEKLSQKLVKEWMDLYMFKKKKSMNSIAAIARYFSNYDTHLLHSRPLTFEKLESFKLKLEVADKTLAELLWDAHIQINGFFNLTGFYKLYETGHGVSWGKQIKMQSVPPQGAQVGLG